jgi:nucleotide-binding universal stress UspA family protein
MNRVIVPLDGSEASEMAIPHGARLARTLGAPILLVHIIDTTRVYDTRALSLLPDREEMRRYLGDVAVREGIEMEVELDVRFGSPTYELQQVAEDHPGGMIVMTTHGRGGLGRLVLGSVADHLVRHGTLPVLLVRAGTTVVPDDGFTNLLVALDGSELAERTLPVAATLAHRAGAALHLLRVVEPLDAAPAAEYPPDVIWLDPDQATRIMGDLEVDAHDYVHRIAASLREIGIDAWASVRIGRPAYEIIRIQDDIAADLIVMASHGYGGVRRWLMGSVTTSVVRQTTTPLLVIPAGADVPESVDRHQETFAAV